MCLLLDLLICFTLCFPATLAARMFFGRGVVVTLATLGIAHCQGTGRWTLDTGRNEQAMHARITLSQTDTRQQRRRNDDIDAVAKAAAAGGAAAPETAAAAAAAAAAVATTMSVATVWIA
jgi:hypothetical protein